MTSTTDIITAGLETVIDAHYADLAAGRALCDGPRLVLADALEESGECERAELIRIECELADMKPPRGIKARHVGMFGDEVKREFHKHGIRTAWGKRWAWLRRRERELLEANWFSWLPELDTHAFRIKTPIAALSKRRLPEIEVEFHRGFPSRLRLPRLADWIGRVCERCDQTGKLCSDEYEHGTDGYFDPAGPYAENDPADPDCADCGCKRSDHIDCPACGGTGRIAGLGPRLVRAVPVERVEFGDVAPFDDSTANGTNGFGWEIDGHGYGQYQLPAVIWNALKNNIPNEMRYWKSYLTADAARQDLSRAAILWALEQKEPTA